MVIRVEQAKALMAAGRAVGQRRTRQSLPRPQPESCRALPIVAKLEAADECGRGGIPGHPGGGVALIPISRQ
jgi:hypothetical protein